MKLRGIQVRYLPGIDTPFSLAGFGDGINIIHGPNGSGKSSLARLLRTMLWPGPAVYDEHGAGARWDADGRPLQASLAGTVRWSRDGQAPADPPPLPAAEYADCFFISLADLLDADSRAHGRLADEVRTLMAGGVDLKALGDSFAVRRGEGKDVEADCRAAQAELVRVRGERRALAAEADRMQELDGERGKARQRLRDAGLVDAAAQLADARRRLADAEAALAGYHPDQALLNGSEHEHLRQLDADLARLAAERDGCRRRAEDAQAVIRECALTQAPPDAGLETLWRTRLHDLDVAAEALQAARDRAATDQTALAQAAAALGVAADRAAQPVAAEGLDGVERWISEAARLQQQAQAVAERIRVLEPQVRADLPDLDRLYAGAEALRRWLASPAPAAGRVPSPGWRVAAAAALVLGVVLGLAVSPWAAILAGIGAAGLALSFAGARRGDGRRTHERQFAETGLATPGAWTEDAVRMALRIIDGQVADANLSRQAAAALRDRQVEAGQVQAAVAANERERAGLCAALGLDPAASRLEIADFAHGIRAWREAQAACAKSAAAAADLAGRVDAGLAAVTAFLAGFGEPAPRDRHEARRLLDSLWARARRVREASAALAEAERADAALAEQAAELARRRGDLFRRLRLDPDDPQAAAELGRRSRAFPEYDAARRAVDQQRATVEHLAGRLRAGNRPDLLDCGPEALAVHRAETEAARTRVEELTAEITRIENQVEAACGNAALEAASARLADAEEGLRRKRQEILERLAARYLVGELEREFEQANQPEVLRDAAALFAGFTRNRYRLRLQGGPGGATFVAEDPAGARLALEALSDGTRLQLLLAARLAFARRAAGETGLPLFVDEALTNSDPDRRDAIIGALCALAGSGWQVFYLTCDPGDGERVRALCERAGAAPAAVFDLAAVRGLAAAAADYPAPASPAPVPAPGAMPAADYARALQVARARLDRPVGELELFHLLGDRLDLVHQLYALGVRTVGQWHILGMAGAQAAGLAAADSARVEAGCLVAEAVHALARRGRGRPVDRRTLAASGAVSGKFIDAVSALADSLGGDGRRLIEVLTDRSDERARGFQAQKTQELAAYLEGEGFVDPRPPVPTDHLLPELFADPGLQAALAAGRVSRDQVAGMAPPLWRALVGP